MKKSKEIIGFYLALPGLVVRRPAVGAPDAGVALSERAVEERQLAQLGSPQVILTLWNINAWNVTPYVWKRRSRERKKGGTAKCYKAQKTKSHAVRRECVSE